MHTQRVFYFTMGHVFISISLNILYFFEDWFYDSSSEKLLNSDFYKFLAIILLLIGIFVLSFAIIYRRKYNAWGIRCCVIYTTLIYATSMSFV